MDKYRLVQERKATEEGFLETQTEQFPEVRITQQGKPRNYISYAMNLFESGSTVIVLKAMGRAINKGVTIAEILKRKMPLHQINDLQSVEMIDVYEPVEEGLDVVTSRRYVSCMKITLSLTLQELATLQPPSSADAAVAMEHDITTHTGYQPPLEEAMQLAQHHQHPQQTQHTSQPHYASQQQHAPEGRTPPAASFNG